MNAARVLAARLNRTAAKPPSTDGLSADDHRLLEAFRRRGFATPGVGEPTKEERRAQEHREFMDAVKELNEFNRTLPEREEARKKAKAEAENPPPQTAVDMLRCVFSGVSSPKQLPLNGAALLRHAMNSLGASDGDVIRGRHE